MKSVNTKLGLEAVTDFLNNEGKASGDFENFLWACRPANWDKAETLTPGDKAALAGFDRAELEAAIDELEAANGYESSREV